MTIQVFIGLGSNLPHGSYSPAEQLQSSLSALAAHNQVGVRVVSSFYASAPVGPQDQPDYINAVARIETDLKPEALLDVLQSIEADGGRNRACERRWGERTLDLDILLYGNQVIETPRLTVPHKQLSCRAFVLYPLAEIAPDLDIPGLGLLADVIQQFEASGELQALHKV